jgi:hypothetical protein
MTMTTFSPKISAQTKKSTKNYWKGLLTAKMTFPTRTSPQTEKSARNYWKAGLYIANVKAYIRDHEAWVLILLAIFLIAGTVFYVAFQSRLDAGTVESPKIAHS